MILGPITTQFALQDFWVLLTECRLEALGAPTWMSRTRSEESGKDSMAPTMVRTGKKQPMLKQKPSRIIVFSSKPQAFCCCVLASYHIAAAKKDASKTKFQDTPTTSATEGQSSPRAAARRAHAAIPQPDQQINMTRTQLMKPFVVFASGPWKQNSILEGPAHGREAARAFTKRHRISSLNLIYI